MRDRLRHLHGETKAVRDIVRPPLVGRQPMRAIERRVDLDTVESVRVSHKMAAFRRKGFLMRLRDRQGGGPDKDLTVFHIVRFPVSRAAP